MTGSRRFGLDEVMAYFQDLEDPRSEINRTHPLASVVVIALIAVLAGASGPTAIARGPPSRRNSWLRCCRCPMGPRARTSSVAC